MLGKGDYAGTSGILKLGNALPEHIHVYAHTSMQIHSGFRVYRVQSQYLLLGFLMGNCVYTSLGPKLAYMQFPRVVDVEDPNVKTFTGRFHSRRVPKVFSRTSTCRHEIGDPASSFQ